MTFIIEILKAVVLGIVQGITEWLPISSTGHLLLINQFLNLQYSESFVNVFMVVIQLGSIMAIVVLFFNKLWPFNFRSQTKQQRISIWKMWTKVLVASIPVGIAGYFLDDIVDQHLHTPFVIAMALIVYGILFIIIEKRNQPVYINDIDHLDYITAANIGLFEALALIPGTSRSGSTIIGSRILHLSKDAAAEFSFFLAIPAMAGASLLKLLKAGFSFSGQEWIILAVGSLVSFIVSIFAVKFLMNYIKKHDFKAFGVYRIILGVLVIVYFYLIAK